MKKNSRMRKGRLLGVVLAAALLLSTLPMAGLTASAAKAKGGYFTYGNPPFAYVVTGLKASEGAYTAKLYQNDDMQSYAAYNGIYTIPAQAYDVEDMRFYTVTEIGGSLGETVPGAMEKVPLQGIVLPNTVKTIGSRAFAGCMSLRELTYPTSIVNVANDAFSGVSLQKLTLNVSEPTTLPGTMAYIPKGRESAVYLPGQITDLVVSAPLSITGQVYLSGDTVLSNTGVTVQSGASLTMNGALSGAGVIEVKNSAVLTMNTPSPAYTGSIRLTGTYSTFTNLSGVAVTVLNYLGRAVVVMPGETLRGGQETEVKPQEPTPTPGPDEPQTPETLKPRIIANYGGSVSVRDNGKTVVISALEGYRVEAVVINGLPMGSITRYEFKEASEENSVVVTFAEGKPAEGPAQAVSFVDVPATASYADAVTFLSNNGIFQGVSRSRFAPDQKATRAMFLSLLSRLEIYGEDFKVEPTFKTVYPNDVPEGSWYADPILWAMGCNIMLPDVHWNLYPKRNITRQEAALCLYRYTHQRGYATVFDANRYSAYVDAALLGNESRQAMVWAATNGYLKSDKGVLDPAGSLTRAEVAEMLARYLQRN